MAAEGVALSDGEVRRMHQLIASGVAPMPLFDILTVKISEDVGFYVIAVPRSPNAPTRFCWTRNSGTRSATEAPLGTCRSQRCPRHTVTGSSGARHKG